MNSLEEARNVLRSGGRMADLAQAIGLLISDPASSLEDLRLGLRHGGFVAEQAEMAIERRGDMPCRTLGAPTEDAHVPPANQQGSAARR